MTLAQGTHTTGFRVNHPVQKDSAANGQPLPTPTDLFNLQMTGGLEIEVDVPFSLSAYLELRGVGDSAFGVYAFFGLPAGYTASVPEPRAWVLMALGIGVLLARTLRRMQRVSIAR